MKAHTRETQATMTPEKALQYLKEGNQKRGEIKKSPNQWEHSSPSETDWRNTDLNKASNSLNFLPENNQTNG